MSGNFLKVTDKFKYDCNIVINKSLIDVIEDDLQGGSKITSVKAGITWNVNETADEVLRLLDKEKYEGLAV